MRRTRGLRWFAVIGLIALVAAACSDDKKKSDSGGEGTTTAASGGDRGNVDGVLKIGLLVPETGDLSAILDSLSKPVTEIAVKEINAAGGVNGKDVVVVQKDDGGGGDDNLAKTSFESLVDSDKVDIVIGPAASATTRSIMTDIKDNKVLTCSGSNTAPDLSDPDSGGYYFRTAPPDKFQGPALAEVIAGDGRTNVAIVFRNDDYGNGFAKALKSALESSGVTVAAEVGYDPNGTNFSSDVQEAVDAAPDAVALIAFPDDGAAILKEMIAKGAGPSQVPIYVTDGLQSSSIPGKVNPENPAVLVGVKGTAPAASPGGIDSPFQDAFAALDVDPIFSAYYYDCTILTALSAVAAKSDDPSKMKDEFAGLLEGDEDCNTFADCKALLEEGKSIHYRGASSNFDTWAGIEPGSGVYDVWEFSAEGKTPNVEGAAQITIEG